MQPGYGSVELWGAWKSCADVFVEVLIRKIGRMLLSAGPSIIHGRLSEPVRVRVVPIRNKKYDIHKEKSKMVR